MGSQALEQVEKLEDLARVRFHLGDPPYFLAFSPARLCFGTDLGSGSAFDRLEGRVRGSCCQHVDETVYLSVLFPRSHLWILQGPSRPGELFPGPAV